MNALPHLLLVEDDREIAHMIAQHMIHNGYRVTTAEDGTSLDRAMAASKVDLVLLDVMLPGEDGFSICRRLRATTSVPILILSARGAESDRVTGLDLGADDYLPKPFSPRELVARVRAVLRRAMPADALDLQDAFVFTFDGWRLDLGRRQLNSPDGARVPLTSSEISLLGVFCRNPRRLLSRDELLELLHGRAAAMFDRSIDIQISRLRRKIEPDPKDPTLIKTVRYGGYMFTAVPDAASLAD